MVGCGIETGRKQSFWLHPAWIAGNSDAFVHPTGQRTARLEDLAGASGRVVTAELAGDELVCTLTTASEALEDRCEPPKGAAQAAVEAPRTWTARVPVGRIMNREPGVATPLLGTTPVNAVIRAAQVQRVDYADLSQRAPAALAAMYRALAADGIAIVTGAPIDSDGTVADVCRALAPVSGPQKTLYGETFKVDTVATETEGGGPRNNIAYTGEFLDLHNDIAYYESMPGLQLLLCRRFDDAVTGGETFFVDAFAAAQDLRKRMPHAFDALCRIPCALKKYDTKRTVPAQYYYGVPHIQLNDMTGQIRKVVWAPAFEAPLPVWYDEGMQRQYYEGRRAFASVLLEWRKARAVSLRLAPGECVVWNQQRLLHGRERFVEPSAGQRRLHGAYVNIDDFVSSCRVALGDDAMPRVALGNGSWL